MNIFEIWRRIKETSELEVKVGVDSGAMYADGISVAKAAMYNEFGTSTIPARPFLAQSMHSNKARMSEITAQAVSNVLSGGTDVEGAGEEIGEGFKKVVQDEIRKGNFVPNAPSTIAGKGSNTPLQDTGKLIESIGYTVGGKGV